MRPHRFFLTLSLVAALPPLAARPPSAELALRYEPSEPLRSRLLFDVALGEIRLEVATWGSGRRVPLRHALRAPGFLAGPAAPSGLLAELLSPVATSPTSAVWSAPTRFAADFSIAPVSRNVLASRVTRAWSHFEAESTAAAWEERGVRAGALTASFEIASSNAASIRGVVLASHAALTAPAAEAVSSERVEAGWFPGPPEPQSVSNVLGSLRLSSAGTREKQLSLAFASGTSGGTWAPPGLWLRAGGRFERKRDDAWLPAISIPLYAALASPDYVDAKLRTPATAGRAGVGAELIAERWNAGAEVGAEANWLPRAQTLLPAFELLAVEEVSTELAFALTPNAVVRRVGIAGSRELSLADGLSDGVVYELKGHVALVGPAGVLDSTLSTGLDWDEGWAASADVTVGAAFDHRRLLWVPEGVELGARVRGELELDEEVVYRVTGALSGRVRVTAPE